MSGTWQPANKYNYTHIIWQLTGLGRAHSQCISSSVFPLVTKQLISWVTNEMFFNGKMEKCEQLSHTFVSNLKWRHERVGCVRGYHIYRHSWSVAVGALSCEREPTNSRDRLLWRDEVASDRAFAHCSWEETVLSTVELLEGKNILAIYHNEALRFCAKWLFNAVIHPLWENFHALNFRGWWSLRNLFNNENFHDTHQNLVDVE